MFYLGIDVAKAKLDCALLDGATQSGLGARGVLDDVQVVWLQVLCCQQPQVPLAALRQGAAQHAVHQRVTHAQVGVFQVRAREPHPSQSDVHAQAELLRCDDERREQLD